MFLWKDLPIGKPAFPQFPHPSRASNCRFSWVWFLGFSKKKETKLCDRGWLKPLISTVCLKVPNCLFFLLVAEVLHISAIGPSSCWTVSESPYPRSTPSGQRGVGGLRRGGQGLSLETSSSCEGLPSFRQPARLCFSNWRRPVSPGASCQLCYLWEDWALKGTGWQWRKEASSGWRGGKEGEGAPNASLRPSRVSRLISSWPCWLSGKGKDQIGSLKMHINLIKPNSCLFLHRFSFPPSLRHPLPAFLHFHSSAQPPSLGPSPNKPLVQLPDRSIFNKEGKMKGPF